MDGIQSVDSGKEMNELLLGGQGVKLRDRILLSPYIQFVLPTIIFALVVPITIYAIIANANTSSSGFSVATCNLRTEYYVNCLPGRNATQTECNAALCCWNDALSFCYHTVPSLHGYTPEDGVYYEGVTLTPRESESPLGSANTAEAYLDVTAVDDNHIQITLSTSGQSSRRRRREQKSFFRRDIQDEEAEETDAEDELTRSLLHFLPRNRLRRTVAVELDGDPILKAYVHYPEFSVTVARDDFRVNEASSILSTARGPLLLTETYWEWTLFVTNGTLYGLNDLEVNGTTNSVYNNENGTITPAFLAISPSGEGAAYYIDYEGPLEVQVLNVSNLVILRGMSLPDSLSVHVFAGPTPMEAAQQLTMALFAASESSSTMPPSYNYGLHVCPNGTLTSVEDAVSDLNATLVTLASILAPWDSHCLHERLVPVLNYVLDADDLDLVTRAKDMLEDSGRNLAPHLSPMILADEGELHAALVDATLLLTNGSSPHSGLYQDSTVVYPDWDVSEVETTATTYLVNYLNVTGSPGSLWLRDAWPKDELDSNSRAAADFSVFDYMPETLKHAMKTLTVPHDLVTASGSLHYATHNAYAQGFRTFVRSFVPTLEFLGPPGEGANTTWSGLRRSVRSAVGAGLVGRLPPPMYVCGTGTFNTTIHDELCIRWYQAAVTWPHVLALPDRLPGGSYLSASAALTVARSLRIRAILATYQHTVVASHFQRGSPVLAPTSIHYPDDAEFTHTWEQFMWGDAILVGLVTLPQVFQVTMRLPGDVSWRHLMGGAEAVPLANGTTSITATIGQIVTLVRPGYIVPIHEEAGDTSMETMSTNLTLAVNLNCEDSCTAIGEIYYGSNAGEYLSLEVNATYLNLVNVIGVQSYACEGNATTQSTFIEYVEVLGDTSYQVDVELCDLSQNIVAVSLA